MSTKWTKSKLPPKRKKGKRIAIGELIQAGRIKKKMGTPQLAKKLNVSYQYVQQIEALENRLSNSSELLAKIAVILDLNLDELISAKPKRRIKKVETTTALGNWLVERRKLFGFTQCDLAKLAGVTPCDVCRLERGYTSTINPKLLVSLQNALKCEIPPELFSTRKTKVRNKTGLGGYVFSRRLKLGLSLEQLAERAGVSYVTIWNIENKECDPRSRTLHKLEKALGGRLPIHLICN